MTTRIGIALLSLALSFAVAAAKDIDVSLTNTGMDSDARARASFDERPDGRQRFEVKVEELDPGSYDIMLDGMSSPWMLVVDADGKGRLREEDSPLLLDPRGKMLDITMGSDVYFTLLFPASRDDARARLDVRERFEVDPSVLDARGEARLRQRRGVTRFDVRVKNLPEGTYDLLVGGVDQGNLMVVPGDDLGETKGKLKFDSRFMRGSWMLLTFEALCQPLAVAQGMTELLNISMFGASHVSCP